MKSRLLIILTTLLTLACQDDNNNLVKVNLSTEDKEIIEKAYSATYQYPADFTYEKDLEGSLYYENTVSIRTSENAWIELSTNDQEQAKAWSEISSTTSAYYRDLVAEKETEKFFQFKRVYSVNPKDIILSRVHKSSYFVPSLDKFNRTHTLGTWHQNPKSLETVKGFIEYLWTSYTAGYLGKVLETTLIDLPDRFQYNLKSVNIIYGDFGLCDIIEVSNFDFFVSKTTGEVTYETTKIKELRGTCH